MALKLITTLLFLSAFVSYGQVGRGDSVRPTPFRQFYKTITNQFERIDRLHQSGGYDSLAQENEKLQELLKRYKPQLFNFPDSLDYDLVYLVKSKDKQLVLISWDTRMGGTMIEFATMAVYKTPRGIETKMLVDASNEDNPNSYMHYNAVYMVTASNGSKIYLAWGNGQGSTSLPWQEIRAFSISSGRLIEPKIFPGKASKIFVEFDLQHFPRNQKVPVIQVKESGRLVLVPVEAEDQSFSGEYAGYRFNGKTFVAR